MTVSTDDIDGLIWIIVLKFGGYIALPIDEYFFLFSAIVEKGDAGPK